MPIAFHAVNDLRPIVKAWKSGGHQVAVVPTMGALHEGHLSLVREAYKQCSKVIVTIFVNPKQFSANEDLDRYPRTWDSDIGMLARENADVVYAPAARAMYAPGFSTTVSLNGPAKAGLEDAYRPHFFDGVATVVAKLFIQTNADKAFFGEKDYQQLMVVTQMAKDLDIPIEVIGVPTMRDTDGMALSSRNRYLSEAERQQAAAIIRTLRHCAAEIRAGHDIQATTESGARALTRLGFNVDYVAVRNAETLAQPQSTDEPLRLLAAAWLGKTRLIDNIAV